ncbi:MAG: ABC transporter substrate-binding protein [Pseudomonadota bacterium]
MRRILVLAALVCLSACGGEPSDVSSQTFIVGIRSTVGPLDPAIAGSVEQTVLLPPVYQRLVTLSADPDTGADVFTPDLAESWIVADDGSSWTFQLADGYRFTDGSKVDAAAVKFSFERAMTLGRGPSAPLKSAVERIETPNDETVVFHLVRPIFSLLPLVSDRVGFIINPKVLEHEIDGDLASQWLSENTSGSGPYQLTKFVPRSTYILERNPHHPASAGPIGEVIFREINDPAVRALMIKRGDLDLAYFLPPESLPSFERDADFEVHTAEMLAFHNLALNIESPVFSDPDLRRAVAYAIDVESIVDVLKEGRSSAFRGPLARGMLGSSDEAYPYRYDPDAAKRLVEKTGRPPEDLDVLFAYPGVSASADTVAVFVQANLEAAGFRVRLQRLTIPAVLDRAERGSFDMMFMGWVSPYADPSNVLNFWFEPDKIGAAGNYARYNNPAVASLVRDSIEETDIDRRRTMIVDAVDLINDDLPYVYLTRNNIWTVSGTWVEGYEIDERDIFNVPYHKLELVGRDRSS